MKRILIFAFVLPFTLSAQLRLSLESGAVFTQYNDVRVPNDPNNQGTLFSFSNDFENNDGPIFFRAELAFLFNKKHIIEATAAPLLRKYRITSDRTIDFAGTAYQGADIEGEYKFNTYRFSYRYRIVDRPKLKFDLGASLLVRDARISLYSASSESEDTDLGYVPLVSFELSYKTTDNLDIILKGDALVGPVGRAEDVFTGVTYNLYKDILKLKAGYRIIEGGADVDQVYNFAFFHFADFGVVSTF